MRRRAALRRRARSRRRSRLPSRPGCPSAPRRAARRAGPPSSRTSRGPAARRAREPRRRRRPCRGPPSPRRRRPSPSIAPATSIPICCEQRLRDRSCRDRERGLTGARPLERVPRVGEAVLERPRQIGMARARQRHRLRPLTRTARPRPATGSSPTPSSRGRGSRRRARAASRAFARDAGPRSTSTRSCSSCCRGLRPYPCWRRARSASIAIPFENEPAGRPVRIATSAGPCDSPAVVSSRVTPTSLRRAASPRPAPERRSRARTRPLPGRRAPRDRRRPALRAPGRPSPSRSPDMEGRRGSAPGQLDEDVVPLRGRVDDEVGAVHIRRPLAPPGERARLWQRLAESERQLHRPRGSTGCSAANPATTAASVE